VFRRSGVQAFGRTVSEPDHERLSTERLNAPYPSIKEEPMERRDFLRHAAAGAAGLMLPAEKEVIDDRLTRKVSLALKATALSDLCEQLHRETGIALVAGNSVADEKVTLFCKKLPLREVMRQLSRPFGYTWLRSGAPGEYRYELAQDLRSQLLEEELRNRDRHAALLALEKEIERYRPYLHLSPDEALALAETAPPGEKKLLENLSRRGWGPLQIYARLSAQDLATLRAGQRLTFSADPSPGEQSLSPDVAQGVLQAVRGWRLFQREGRFEMAAADEAPEDALPLSAVPAARAVVVLAVSQSELGEYTLSGQSGFFTAGTPPDIYRMFSTGPLATGRSPAVLKPRNAKANVGRASDAALRLRVSLRPEHSCRHTVTATPTAPGSAAGKRTGSEAMPESRVSSADILEALHRATGLNIVGDYYTRFCPQAEVVVQDAPLSEALNRIADAMRLRWVSEAGAWLQFRSTSYYDDRLKEVPDRLLVHWASARKQHAGEPSPGGGSGQGSATKRVPGPGLTLDALLEIAQLPDAQLDAAEMAEGARACYGLAEWDLARHIRLRPHLRYLAGFSPAQRREATSSAGLPFARMSLAQQQQFLANLLTPGAEPIHSFAELDGAVLRVEYTQPGEFEWRPAGAPWFKWVVPLGPGVSGRRALTPIIRERTREAALQAARRVDGRVIALMLEIARRTDPRFDEGQMIPQEAQIVPTALDLTILYVPGASNRRPIHVVRPDGHLVHETW
jgi:hypothetical protein